MSLTFKRLGAQGEIHISDDGEYTLCGIRATHPNWINSEEKTDKDPLVCVDCLESKPKPEIKEEKPSAKKETTPSEAKKE
jgi:hypothetical protein